MIRCIGKLSVWIALFAGTLGLLKAEIVLAENSRSDYRIHLDASASASERTAAQELQKYLRLLSGAELPISQTAGEKNIYLGQSPEVRALLSDVDFTRLKTDEIIIRTVGNSLILSGDRQRGTLYAVYSFLEKQCGVRWWSSREEEIPTKPRLAIGAVNERHASPFTTRETFLTDAIDHPAFAVKLKNNGHHLTNSDAFGGNDEIIGWVHTFDQFVPARTFLASNPEYFSLVDGRRLGGQDQGQLCLTNPDVLRVMLASIRERLQAKTSPRILAVSQNDNQNYCRCDACNAFARTHGQSGLLLQFVNSVAAALETDYPNLKIMTLAYQYTRRAPANVVPHRNVIIQLCSIECSFAQPLTAPENQAFANDLRDWSRIAPDLAIWDYVSNFSNYLTPFPNYTVWAENLRFFAANGVTRIFEQGDYQSGGVLGDCLPLRMRVISQLVWNPALDQDELLNTFLLEYYKEAAPSIRQYLDLLSNSVRQYDLTIFQTDITRFLSFETLLEASRLLRQAEQAVANNPVLANRVKTLRFAIDISWMEYYPLLTPERKAAAGNLLPDFPALLNHVVSYGRQNNIQCWKEGHSFDELESRYRAMLNRPALPPEFQGIPDAQIIDAPAEFFTTSTGGSFVSDPQSPDYPAAKTAGNHRDWSIQWHVAAAKVTSQPRWRAYFYVRSDAEATAAGDGAEIGSYDRITKQHVMRKVPVSDIAGTEYRKIDGGLHSFTGSPYFYLAPAENPDVNTIYLKRIILVAE